MGIATRVNGTAPPDVPLSDIDLGSVKFWSLDDDIRDGAFTTLRHEAPVSFYRQIVQEGFPEGAGHWALTRYDDVFYASRHPEVFSSSQGITIGDQNPELAEFFGSMIAYGRPTAFATTQYRAQRVYATGGGPHRGLGSRARPSAGFGDGGQPSGRRGRRRRRTGRSAAAADHLRHDGHPRGRPSAGLRTGRM